MNTYQQAKARLAQVPSNNRFAHPDSLTRRNGTLIASRWCGQYDRKWIQACWESAIRELFPDAEILKTTVDRFGTARCYFSL